jgi:hypothetical protein
VSLGSRGLFFIQPVHLLNVFNVFNSVEVDHHFQLHAFQKVQVTLQLFTQSLTFFYFVLCRVIQEFFDFFCKLLFFKLYESVLHGFVGADFGDVVFVELDEFLKGVFWILGGLFELFHLIFPKEVHLILAVVHFPEEIFEA